MAGNDLEHIESVFHAVVNLPEDKRTAYLEDACAGDESLCAEVRSLVSALESGNGFMERPALELGYRVLSGAAEDSMVGKSIGAYKVLSRLGKGGMGEVYLAEDTRLDRKVALKFLSPERIGDNWAKRQLVKEAQAVAQLDHPNICAVYGIEEHEDHHFIVMQFIEGKTLAELVRSNALKSMQFLELALQIVGAIAEAHAHGIIHKDIKPGNIMVTPTGQAKVLDFGLAKIVQKQNLESFAESASDLSQTGIFQGTVAYMSPEQLRGEKLDYRTDVFSIGTVLYEMLSGVNPHACGTEAEIISYILSRKPLSLNRGSKRVSHQLDVTVLKCLEKAKEARYQSATELLLRLQTIQSVRQSRLHPASFLDPRIFLTAVVICLIAVVVAYFYSAKTPPKSIVVFPIKNETGDVTLEYLADGFTDSFTNRLTGLSTLHVKAPSLVFGYKNQDVSPLKVGQDLRADGVLVGKISGSKDLPVLQLSLINTIDGSEKWRTQFGVDDLQKIFEIEASVAKSVAVNLESASAADEISKPRDPENSEARKQYWLGLYYWRHRNNDGTLEKAIRHFEDAIKLEPSYARAHAGLADCYAYINAVAYGRMDTREAMTRAEKAARDALELDPTLAEAHTSLAIVNLKYFWNWQEAEKEFKRAIELKPDYFHAHYGYSSLLTILGRHEESIREGQIAKDLDPFSAAASFNHCRTLYFAHQFDAARQCFDDLITQRPEYTVGRYARGLVYLRDGMYWEALDVFERIYASDRRLAGAFLGYTYAVTGNQKAAERVLSELQKESNLSGQEFAFIYIGLGKTDEAINLLQRSAEERYAPFPFLATDPLFPKLQADPRFIAIIKRYGLPSPATN